jgi:hypothetical protein
LGAEMAMTYDVVVIGGGAGGVGAAVGAAQAGARVLLVDGAGALGGAASIRGVITYCGVWTLGDTPRQVLGGVGADVLARLATRGAISGPQRFRGVFATFDPEANKIVLDEVCADAGVDVRLHSRLIAATRDGGQITSVTLHDHSGAHVVHARAFVDASGEADLAFFAGASTRYGNDGAANLGSLATRFGGIPKDVTITADQFCAAVTAAKARGEGPFAKDRSVIPRLPISHDLVLYVASVDYDQRDAGAHSRAEAEGRRQSQAYLGALRTIQGCEDAYIVSTGPEFGVRESRHLNAVRQMTWDDVQARARYDDCIALGAWGAEWHDRATLVSTMDFAPDKGMYGIPLSCLQSADTGNLFAAGRTADGDRLAGAAIRVMGTALATGQAAGVAAALGADAQVVRAELRRQGGALNVADLDRLGL